MLVTLTSLPRRASASAFGSMTQTSTGAAWAAMAKHVARKSGIFFIAPVYTRMMAAEPAMPIPDDVKQWRKAERARLLALREAMAADERRAHNETITRRLIDGFPQLAGMTVGFYWPRRGEFDARIAMLHLRKLGARTALPVVVQKGAPLQFRVWWPGAPTT